MVVRRAAARERRRVERNPARFDERLERLGGVRPPHAAAPEHDRTRRLSEERDRFLHRAFVAPRARERLPRGRIDDARLVDLLAEDVTGQVQVDGADASGRRLAEGGREMFGDTARVVDPLRPLRDRLEHGELIDLLERLHAERHARARAADGDERRRVGEGVGHAGEEIRRAGARGAHAHARLPHHAAPGLGGQRGGLLVTRVDRANAELDAGGFGLQHRAAHDVEHRVDAL